LRVLTKVYAVVCLEALSNPLNNAFIKVVAPKIWVATGAQDINAAFLDLQECHVKGAAPKIEHRVHAIVLRVQTVRESSHGRLIANAQDFQTG